jgi:aspartate kinase
MTKTSAITAKFGGTSLANAAQFKKAKNIILSNPARRFIILSAPGKEHKKDIKITDLLIGVSDRISQKKSWTKEWNKVERRFSGIIRGLGLKDNLGGLLKGVESTIKKNLHKDFILSRGEYLSGIIMAEYLNSLGIRASFVDTAKCIFFKPSGLIDEKKTYKAIRKNSPKKGLAIFPGFYGTDALGRIKVFSRGGTDLTGALVASALKTKTYENWTDVDGFLRVNPKYVKNPGTIDSMNYRQARLLSYAGAVVLHEETIPYLKKNNIVLHVRNTNNPKAPGTNIISNRDEDNKVIGIAEQGGFIYFEISKILVHERPGHGARLFKVFADEGISYAYEIPGTDESSLIISVDKLCGDVSGSNASEINKKIDRRVAEIGKKLKEKVSPDKIRIVKGVGVINTIGSSPTALLDILLILKSIGIMPYAAVQGRSGQVIVAIPERSISKAVKTIHRTLFTR